MPENICRLCGERSGPLESVSLCSTWYLVHTVDQHWDMLEILRQAIPEIRAAALGLAAARGWTRDTNPDLMIHPDITAAARDWVNTLGPNLTPGEELGDRELEAAFVAGVEWMGNRILAGLLKANQPPDLDGQAPELAEERAQRAYWLEGTTPGLASIMRKYGP